MRRILLALLLSTVAFALSGCPQFTRGGAEGPAPESAEAPDAPEEPAAEQ